MTIGLLFWFLMVVALLFGFYVGWPRTDARVPVSIWGGSLLWWVLLLLLGWQAFGPPLRG